MTAPPDDPTPTATPPLVARLLGEATLTVGERPLPKELWPRRAARDLLLLLLVTPGHRLHRDVVLDTLWPEASPEVAANHLYKALHALRRVLEPDLARAGESAYLRTVAETIFIPPAPGCDVDLDRFLDLLTAARASEANRRDRLRAAIAGYGGDLIADEPYADWLFARRERVRRLWLEAVLDLAELDRAAGEPLATLPALETACAAEPSEEAVHRAIIRAHAAAGQPDAALRAYDRCVTLLREELHADPSEETAALAASIRAAPPIPPAPSRPRVRPLPLPPSALIGRDDDLTAIQDLLLDARCRLLTLTGPGGIGKSHLALVAGAILAAEFPDGAAFVPLAALRNPDDVIPAIAATLGVRDEPGEPLADRLADALRGLSLLIVLDNVEPVIAAAPRVAELLAAAPGFKVLATSRERLRLRGERELPIGPLPAPDPRRLPSLPTLRRMAAVQLFAERAAERRSDFAIDEANASAVGGICHRLDGIPLAIELAAARAHDLGPDELLLRLTRRLPLLTDGPRDLPARLQTMRDAIAWSYDLLAPAEQRLFRRLAIFAGGFTLEAAEAVCGPQAEGRVPSGCRKADDTQSSVLSPQSSVLDRVASLVEKNLLRREGNGDDARYAMLETIREFGLERLAGEDDAAAVGRAHAAAFVALAANAEPALTGPDQLAWLDRLELEHDNLRAALAWSIEAGAAETALRLGGSIWRFWSDRGLSREGREWLRRGLALGTGEGTAVRGRAVRAAGLLAEDLGDLADAGLHHEAALAIWQALGERSDEAIAYDDLGSLAHNRGDFARGDELHHRALQIATETGNRRVALSANNNLGVSAHHRGDLATARRHYLASRALADDPAMRALLTGNLAALAMAEGDDDEAIALGEEALADYRRLGADRGIADALLILAAPLMRTGVAERAQSAIDEALARYSEMHDRYGQSAALLVLGDFEREWGALETATARFRGALRLAREIDNRVGVAESLEQLGETLRRRGDPHHAATLFGTAAALRDELGAARPPAAQRDYDAWLTALRGELDAPELAGALDQGRATPLDSVVVALLAPNEPS